MSHPGEQNEECLICRKQRGEFSAPGGAVYCDELVYASHAHFQGGQERAYLGWLVLETRRHAPGLADLTDAEGRAIGLLAARLSRALSLLQGVEHVYAFVVGHGVPHFHLHLLPRYPGTPGEYWGMRIDEWPEAPRGGQAEIEQLCARVRAYLGEFINE
ncbi:MAG TPA: hypothetical protein VLA49_07920 [Anaerolineales bacterium]|nr:hypothetical protein [Anaerolineales bacterium]